MSMLSEGKRRQKWSLNPRGLKHESKFGKALMEKMGWNEGQGLGASKQGIVDPIALKLKNDSKGVGFKGVADAVVAHQDGFEELLRGLNSQHSSTFNSAKNSDDDDEEKAKSSTSSSRNRNRYHKARKAKNARNYSSRDLECILGKAAGRIKLKEEDSYEGEDCKNFRPSFKQSSEAAAEEADGKDDVEGIVTINKGSANDYFQNKMAEMMSKRKPNDESKDEAEPPTADGRRKKKRKKNKENEADDEEEKQVATEKFVSAGTIKDYFAAKMAARRAAEAARPDREQNEEASTTEPPESQDDPSNVDLPLKSGKKKKRQENTNREPEKDGNVESPPSKAVKRRQKVKEPENVHNNEAWEGKDDSFCAKLPSKLSMKKKKPVEGEHRPSEGKDEPNCEQRGQVAITEPTESSKKKKRKSKGVRDEPCGGAGSKEVEGTMESLENPCDPSNIGPSSKPSKRKRKEIANATGSMDLEANQEPREDGINLSESVKKRKRKANELEDVHNSEGMKETCEGEVDSSSGKLPSKLSKKRKRSMEGEHQMFEGEGAVTLESSDSKDAPSSRRKKMRKSEGANNPCDSSKELAVVPDTSEERSSRDLLLPKASVKAESEPVVVVECSDSIEAPSSSCPPSKPRKKSKKKSWPDNEPSEGFIDSIEGRLPPKSSESKEDDCSPLNSGKKKKKKEVKSKEHGDGAVLKDSLGKNDDDSMSSNSSKKKKKKGKASGIVGKVSLAPDTSEEPLSSDVLSPRVSVKAENEPFVAVECSDSIEAPSSSFPPSKPRKKSKKKSWAGNEPSKGLIDSIEGGVPPNSSESKDDGCFPSNCGKKKKKEKYIKNKESCDGEVLKEAEKPLPDSSEKNNGPAADSLSLMSSKKKKKKGKANEIVGKVGLVPDTTEQPPCGDVLLPKATAKAESEPVVAVECLDSIEAPSSSCPLSRPNKKSRKKFRAANEPSEVAIDSNEAGVLPDSSEGKEDGCSPSNSGKKKKKKEVKKEEHGDCAFKEVVKPPPLPDSTESNDDPAVDSQLSNSSKKKEKKRKGSEVVCEAGLVPDGEGKKSKRRKQEFLESPSETVETPVAAEDGVLGFKGTNVLELKGYGNW